MDWKTETTALSGLLASASDDARVITGKLHTAGIHLSNIRDSLNKPKLPELCAIIVDNASYNSTLTARLKMYLDKIAASNVRHVALFQNKQQMAAAFPLEVTRRGLQFTLDTMWSVRRTCTDKEFEAYMVQAEKFNVQAFRFDDAHNNTPDELAAAVTFMRRFTDAPIYGSFGALDEKTVKDTRTGKDITVPVDMQAYVDAGLKIVRQFFRQEQVTQQPDAPTAVIAAWLKSGRITHGVDLEAFAAGGITTSPQDFLDMLLLCLEADIDVLSVYAVVNGQKWQMWSAAVDLWQSVQHGARLVRVARK